MNFIKIQPNSGNNVEEFCSKMVNHEKSFQIPGKIGYRIAEINKTGHWSEKQNARYYAFLLKFKEKFAQKEFRRQWKVFKALSEFVKTRNANQCRSHHHKMQRNFQTIQQTLQFLKKKIPALEKKCQRYIEQLEKIQEKIFAEGSVEIYQRNVNQTISKEKIISSHSISFEQYQREQTMGKKLDIGNLRTGLTEEDGQNIFISQPINSFFGPQEKKFSNFPSTGLLSSLNQSNYTHNQYSEPHQDFSNPHIQFIGQTYEQRLMECQQIFVRWYNKLNNLLSQEQEQAEMKHLNSQTDQREYFHIY